MHVEYYHACRISNKYAGVYVLDLFNHDVSEARIRGQSMSSGYQAWMCVLSDAAQSRLFLGEKQVAAAEQIAHLEGEGEEDGVASQVRGVVRASADPLPEGGAQIEVHHTCLQHRFDRRGVCHLIIQLVLVDVEAVEP